MERAGVLLPLKHTVSRELVGDNPEVFSPETERVHLAAGAFGYTGGSVVGQMPRSAAKAPTN